MSKTKKFGIVNYQALADEISDLVLDHQEHLLRDYMPEKHANTETMYYVSLKVITKMICKICLNDMEARKILTEKFIKTLPDLVREAVVVEMTHSEDGSVH